MRAFLAVAEELHFGKAADRLGIAQPPLSRTIRRLEEELGARLFDRTTRSVSLTPSGSALLEPARRVVEATDAAAESIQKLGAGTIGTVRMGFVGSSGGAIIADIIAASKERNPGIDFIMEADVYTPESLPRLLEGTLDLALVRSETLPSRITGRNIQHEAPAALVRNDHPLAQRESVTIKEIADERFIMLPGHPSPPMREYFYHWFQRSGLEPKVIQEAPDMWMIGALVARGLGISLTLDSKIAGLDMGTLVMVPLDVDHAPIPVQIAHKTSNDDPALLEVLKTAQDVLPTIS